METHRLPFFHQGEKSVLLETLANKGLEGDTFRLGHAARLRHQGRVAHPCGFCKGGDFELWAQQGYATGSLDTHSFSAQGCLMELNLSPEL